MSNQRCSIRIFSLVLCLIAYNVNAQHLILRPQFGSSVISTGSVSTFNSEFNSARSINAETFLQSNVQTNENQGQELSTRNDEPKNKPTPTVISFVIPSYASGITHLLDLSAKPPNVSIPSDELLPPIGDFIGNSDGINSRTLLPTQPQTLPDILSTTKIAANDNYNSTISNVTPITLFNKTITETTANPVTETPIEKLTIANFDNFFQATTLATIPTIQTIASIIPGTGFTTKSSESQNTTNSKITHQNVPSTDSTLQMATTLSPESWRRLLILGEQKIPGYAVKSDGSIDSNITFAYSTTVPNFGFKKWTKAAATPILLPTPGTVDHTSSPRTTFAELNNNPFLPPVNNLSEANSSSLFKNNALSTLTNSSNPFAAFKFTLNNFRNNTKEFTTVPNRFAYASFDAPTTQSESLLTATETTTEAANPLPTGNPTVSTLSGFAKGFASNVSVMQPSSVRNESDVVPQNIQVPDNNPFLAPLAPNNGIATPNFASTYQVNIQNGKSTSGNINEFKNRQNIPTTSVSSVNSRVSSTADAVHDSFRSTSKPFTAFSFRASNASINVQTFDNRTNALTNRIRSNEITTTTETSNHILFETSTIQPASQTHSIFFEPVTDSIVVGTSPNFPSNELLPPLSFESSDTDPSNGTTNSSFTTSHNPFLPTLDLNPFLAPFSQTVPGRISPIPLLNIQAQIPTTKPNIIPANFPSQFDNSALRKNFFQLPSTQLNNFKYTGGFGGAPGILSPYDRKLQ